MKKAINVLVTSGESGGGHKALRASLVESLKSNESLNVKEYHSEQESWQKMYEKLVRVPFIWEYIVKYGDKKPLRYLNTPFVKIPESKNAEKALDEFNPDIVIVTMAVQAGVFYDLRKEFGLKYILVSAIPDLGDQKSELLLSHEADFYLVRDEYTKNYLKQYVEEDKLIIFGTKVNPVFNKVKKLSSEQILKKANGFLEKEFTDRALKKDYRNILILGGSGWTFKSKRLIEKLSELNEFNIFVVCGKDKRFAAKLIGLDNVFPLGFLSQEELAVLERFCDVAVLSPLAPATMLELMTINKYPLFVHRHIKGQETPHLKYIVDFNIGIYQDNDEKMITLIKNFLVNPDKFSFMTQNARSLVKIENQKAKENANIVSKIIS